VFLDSFLIDCELCLFLQEMGIEVHLTLTNHRLLLVFHVVLYVF
jgi:hypothetical protein